jgi:dissimilatory sulfite reductase (desulfoviridin) alpha/beta subunit
MIANCQTPCYKYIIVHNYLEERSMSISAEQRKQVKGQGFLSNKDQVHFSARIITENGVLNARQLRNLSQAAKKFGNGNISFTSRLAFRMPTFQHSRPTLPEKTW